MEEQLPVEDTHDDDQKQDEWPEAKKTELLDISKLRWHDMEDLFIKLTPPQWAVLFNMYAEEIRTAGRVLANLVERKGHQLAPKPWNIFRAYHLTPWVKTKVVIIGQDPYYLAEGSEPSATGCCFECAPGMPIRQSLTTILLRLESTVDGFKRPASGDLTNWAVQGVLLMNAALTTNVGEKLAHASIWEFFAIRVLQFLAEKKKHVVYMLWGRFAQGLKKYINANDNLILEASHPAARGNGNTFRKCNHFNEANEYLASKGRTPIDWRL